MKRDTLHKTIKSVPKFLKNICTSIRKNSCVFLFIYIHWIKIYKFWHAKFEKKNPTLDKNHKILSKIGNILIIYFFQPRNTVGTTKIKLLLPRRAVLFVLIFFAGKELISNI